MRWLVPRLARFLAANRNVDVQIFTSHQAANFQREDVDACIQSDACGPTAVNPSSSICVRRLFGEVVTPVCSPALLTRDPPLREPRDLVHHTLLSSFHRPHDWPTWLAAAGVADVNGNSGIRLENSALSYQAAIDEVGVVVAQSAFIQEDLRTGRLVELFSVRAVMDWAYFFAYPSDRAKSTALELFEQWLVEETRTMDALQRSPVPPE